jgi:hypothetical protein
MQLTGHPTYDLLSPDFDILQAIASALNSTNFLFGQTLHTLRDTKTEPSCGANLTFEQKPMYLLNDKQADDIYQKSLQRIGLFPTWIPGTLAALFHGERQVTKGIPVYIRDAAHMPAMKEYLIRCSKEATGCNKSWDEAT